MVLDFWIKALFVSYGVICLLCLPLLAIWTSPKSNVSMVNWLADCRFDLDYRIAWRIQQKENKLLQALHSCALAFVHAQPIITLWWHTIGFCYFCQWLALYFINLSSADGIAVIAVCCQSMSSVQYACNSTEASAPWCFILSIKILDLVKQWWIYICAISVISFVIAVLLSGLSMIAIVKSPLPLNDTSTTAVCPGEQDVAQVLSNFSDPDYFLACVTLLSTENTAASTIIDLVGSTQPVNMTYEGHNISLQQARNIRLYALPGSLFTIIFSFNDSQNRNLTVDFTVYTQDGHPGKTYNSQPVGPFTTSNSASFSANESSYVEVRIKNYEGLTGYYNYNFEIKEIHNLNHKCTLNSTVSSCTLSPTLPGRNIILGIPSHDSGTAQCHPILNLSLIGQKKRFELLYSVPFAVLIVVFVLAIPPVTGCVKCIHHDRSYNPLP